MFELHDSRRFTCHCYQKLTWRSTLGGHCVPPFLWDDDVRERTLYQFARVRQAMLSVLLNSLFFAVFNVRISIRKINFFSIHGFIFSTPFHSITINKITFLLHLPSSTSPYWATVTAEGYSYKDDYSTVSLDKATGTFWFFPVLFRHTAGSWITTTLDGLSLLVFSSERTPDWVTNLRNDILGAMFDGETIRLHYIKTSVIQPPEIGSKPGPAQLEDQTGLQLKFVASKWHIVKLGRMYVFGELELTFQRDWLRDRGSVVLSSKESQWTELPNLPRQEGYRRASLVWQLLQGLSCFPWNIIKAMLDPLSRVDIVVTTANVEFNYFRLRDAGLLCNQTVMKVEREWQEIIQDHPDIFQDIFFDILSWVLDIGSR